MGLGGHLRPTVLVQQRSWDGDMSPKIIGTACPVARRVVSSMDRCTLFETSDESASGWCMVVSFVDGTMILEE